MSKIVSIARNTYPKVNRVLFTILITITPILFVTNTNELYEFPKMFFVYIVGTTTIFAFSIYRILVMNSEGKVKKLKFPSKRIVVFLLVFILATIFSEHAYTSLWSYYTRFNGGLISTLIYIGLYFVSINTLKKPDLMDLFSKGLYTSAFVSFYAVTQHYEFISMLWDTPAQERVFSTLGQPNWLAAYFLMILPLNFYKIFSSHEKTSEALYTALFLMNFAALWFTYSISGIIGLGFVLMSVLYFGREYFLLGDNFKKTGVILGMLFFIAIFNPGIFGDRIRDVMISVDNATQETELEPSISSGQINSSNNAPNNPTVAEKAKELEKTIPTEKTENPTFTVSDTGSIRTGLWEGSIELWTSSPKVFLIGTGPETFAYTFQKFRPKSLNYTSEWNFIFNKPHNYYLELLTTVGILGFASYLYMLMPIIKKPDFIWTSAIVGLIVSNVFGWPTVTTALYFWLILSVWGISENET